MKKTQLQALLDHAISDSPDKTAIHFKTHSYSYLELHHLSKKLAAGLQNNGVNKGDRVAIFLPNCPEAVMLFLACYMLGAIAVPLNYRYLSELKFPSFLRKRILVNANFENIRAH